MQTYIEITPEQIEFLKQYPRPWSYLGKRNPLFALPPFLSPDQYSRFSIRVASACLPTLQHSNTPTLNFPLFLTSANLSGSPESKTLAEARASFPDIDEIDGGICDEPPSDIFYFDESGEMVYMRQYTN